MTIAAAVALLGLSGCAVGPDFKRPEAPGVTSYTEAPLSGETTSAPGAGGAPQRFVTGRDIPAEWWTLFRSEALDALIRRAIAESPTIAAARAALAQARENVRAQTAILFFPGVDASLSAERRKISGVQIGVPGLGDNIYNVYNATVSVSYTLDVFGGGRRNLESLVAQADSQAYQLEGAHLTLAANIVTASVREAMLRGQIATTREIIALEEEQLTVVESRFELGGVARSDVLTQKTQLAQTRATLPPLEKALAQTRHQLAVLAGGFPGETTLAPFDLDTLHLPEDLPVSLPSDLVRQRPDIRASESLFHQACANVGVATANLYPQITLTGSYGTEASRTGDLLNGSSSLWSLAAGLLQPVFHGGELTAKRRAAIAAYEQAGALYRQTVLEAFQGVADTLRALESDAMTLRAQTEAETAARDALELAKMQFQAGAVSYLSLLTAQRQYHETRVGVLAARAARYADTAALFQALGGGWWNRPPGTLVAANPEAG